MERVITSLIQIWTLTAQNKIHTLMKRWFSLDEVRSMNLCSEPISRIFFYDYHVLFVYLLVNLSVGNYQRVWYHILFFFFFLFFTFFLVSISFVWRSHNRHLHCRCHRIRNRGCVFILDCLTSLESNMADSRHIGWLSMLVLKILFNTLLILG